MQDLFMAYGIPEYFAYHNEETGEDELWKSNFSVPDENTPVGELPLALQKRTLNANSTVILKTPDEDIVIGALPKFPEK